MGGWAVTIPAIEMSAPINRVLLKYFMVLLLKLCVGPVSIH
jgi:hypothetical protein